MNSGNFLVGGIILATALWAVPAASAAGSDAYLGSDLRGNYVWCIVMNLAWNELGEVILHGKPGLKTKDAAALRMVESFNTSTFSRKDLDAQSYYVRSGFGQRIVDLINQETKARFPGRTFPPLRLRLARSGFIAYAYFLKLVTYPTPFTEGAVLFQNAMVDGFYAAESLQRRTVRILKYWDDDRFIISLQLSDGADELFLAKGFDMKNPAEAVSQINGYASAKPGRMEEDDIFQMPKLRLEHNREYRELMGTPERGPFLSNKGFTDYFIGAMFENIKFDLDHKGARVEAEAVIDAQRSSPPVKKIRRLIMNKPFWVVMKRAESSNPYLIIGVNNPELMKKR